MLKASQGEAPLGSIIKLGETYTNLINSVDLQLESVNRATPAASHLQEQVAFAFGGVAIFAIFGASPLCLPNCGIELRSAANEFVANTNKTAQTEDIINLFMATTFYFKPGVINLLT